MYFSVTSENCRIWPVFSSVFDRRTDLMKLPNSAPMTSSGTLSPLSFSTLIPSSPIRLTASVPSTRSRIPCRTSLNDTPLLPLLHLLEPRLELDRFRISRLGTHERVEFLANLGIAGIALQNGLVNLARFAGKSLLNVKIRHRERLRCVINRTRCRRRRLGRREDVGRRFFLGPWRRHLCRHGRRGDVDSRRLLDLNRGGGVVRDRILEGTLGVRSAHRFEIRSPFADRL